MIIFILDILRDLEVLTLLNISILENSLGDNTLSIELILIL